jgi:thiamine pyrophosphate-dependent acetolactate synthase large subunit-like protein
VIVCGNGARPFRDDVVALAEHIDAPIITTFKAKGLVGDDHPLACGTVGRSGIPVASQTMARSDCLLVLGASFSNHTSIATYVPTIQVDFDRMALGRFHPVEVPLWGDIGRTVAMLRDGLPHSSRPAQRDAVATRWERWRNEKHNREGLTDGRGRLHPALIFRVLSELTPHDAVIAVDVGNNAYSFGRYFETRRGQHVLMSGYLGSIGFGYPAAMGAWAANSSRPVVAVTGDGGFGQYAMELTTAVKYGMPIKHVLLDNHGLGKISKEQVAGDFPVWQTSLVNPDWAQFATLCGATGLSARSVGELDGAFEQLFAASGPALLHVEQDTELV